MACAVVLLSALNLLHGAALGFWSEQTHSGCNSTAPPAQRLKTIGSNSMKKIDPSNLDPQLRKLISDRDQELLFCEVDTSPIYAERIVVHQAMEAYYVLFECVCGQGGCPYGYVFLKHPDGWRQELEISEYLLVEDGGVDGFRNIGHITRDYDCRTEDSGFCSKKDVYQWHSESRKYVRDRTLRWCERP